MKPKLPWVYCAGKIEHTDWRHYVAANLKGIPFGTPLQCGYFTYCGPYFVSCGHGCAHGKNRHAMLPPDCFPPAVWEKVITRDDVPGLCRGWLERADMVFAWIDCADCFGTLVELGWATALGKPVYVAFEGHKLMEEMWFITKCRNVHVGVHDNADIGLRHAVIDLKLAQPVSDRPRS